MAQKSKDGKGYQCMFCNLVLPRSIDMDTHQKEIHDYLLLPLTREELNRLLMFIRTKDEQLITERLYKTLKNYAKFRVKSDFDSE